MATTWVMTRGADNLLRQVNQRFPRRSKKSDGGIGDLAHQLESASSHNPDKTGRAEWKDGDAKNEVRARDFDVNLNDEYGVTTEQLIQYLVKIARAAYLAGAYFPIRYLIYNRRIWSVSWGWTTRTYTGESPHTEHWHATMAFSQRADEDSTYDYHLDTLGVPKEEPMTPAEQDALIKRLLNTKVADYADGKNPHRELTLAQWIGFSEGRGQINALRTEVFELRGQLTSLKADLAQVLSLLQPHSGQ